MNTRTKEPSMLAVLERTVTALAQADTATLERLAAEVEGTPLPEGERGTVREAYRTLGLLLEITRRNLRLLRGEYGVEYTRCRSRG